MNELSHKVIGCAIEVHKALGSGLLETAYQKCLGFKLAQINIPFEYEKQIPIKYKNVHLDCGYRMDFLVDNTLVVELKSIDKLLPIHEAQLITYLKLTGLRLGLLINFNVIKLKDGIKRIIM